MSKIPRRLFKVVAWLAVLLGIEMVGWWAIPAWSITASSVSRATPQQIWSWYADTRDWPNWDHLVNRVESKGPFVTGTVGISQSSGLTSSSKLADVRENISYTEILRLPLATLTATHELLPTPQGTRIKHGIRVAGPAAWVLYLVKREQLQQGMNEAMHRLATHAADGLPKQRIR